jgi:site-specific recombinase
VLSVLTLLGQLDRPGEDGDHRPLAALIGALRPGSRGDPKAASDAVEMLTHTLDQRPELGAALRRYLGALLAAKRLRRLYDETGIQPEDGFFIEASRRLTHRILPPLRDLGDGRDVLGAVFGDARDGAWIASVDDEVWAAPFARVTPEFAAPLDGRRVDDELLDALSVVTHRIASAGLDPALVRTYPDLDAYESPFAAQGAEAHAFVESAKLRDAGEERGPPVDERQLKVLLNQCSDVLQRIRRGASATGASVGLTYKLQRLRDLITRARALLGLLAPTADDGARRLAAASLFKALVAAEGSRNALLPLVIRNTQLLAEQVTARAGRSGERYITATRAEYAAMFGSAAGAGVLVALGAHAKIAIAGRHLPPLVHATLVGLTYVAVFVTVQLLHFTVATKQPAMTAATLAAAIDEPGPGPRRIEALTELIVRLVRSQFVAILGNVVVAFPVAWLASVGLAHLSGAPSVGAAKATELVASTYPLRSAALPHATIAGVWLFASGILAGYFDNAAVYHHLPERIAEAPWIRRLLGARLAARLGRFMGHGLGALAGNTAFGLLLGYTAFFGVILGLPIDIRHVSFSSANLAIGLHALDFDVSARSLAAMVLGLGLVGVVNLVVSFSLSLVLAFHSRQATFGDAGALTLCVARRFARRPVDFLFPPPDEPAPASPAE